MLRRAQTTSRSPARRGFTLLEMIVAVGAVALISVGLASIFRAVGKTVAGGKRVSLVTNYASLLESRMRADFANLTRRGPLVIRQQWVDVNDNGVIDDTQANGINVDDVRLSPGGSDQATALSERPRRIDEIMFFAQGEFVSARQSPLPDTIVRSNEARIYYGHGQRLDVRTKTDPTDDEPELEDPNASLAGGDSLLGRGDESNPNYFAGNWILLRHQTLLTKPETAPQPGAQVVLGVPASSGRLTNKPTQIACLPAASSVFRSIAVAYPNFSGTFSGLVRDNPKLLYRQSQNSPVSPRFDAGIHPLFSSGIVDIATTSLDEIRATILGNCTNSSGGPTLPRAVWTSRLVPTPSFEIPRTDPASPAARPPVSGATSLDAMQAWMDDLMPTQSVSDPAQALYPAPGANTNDPAGVRIRCEALAPGLDVVMQEMALAASASNVTRRRELQEEKTDREMVTYNNLLPRCSEFKVEWSFGDPDPDPTRLGQVVWFGPRPGNGPTPDTTSPAPYPFTPNDSAAQTVEHKIPRTQRQGAMEHTVSGRLIYGDPPAAGDRPSTLTSYFGYVDPTYDRSTGAGPAALPWAWPTLIRVTVSLADQNDPSYEATFQFVFAVPDDSPTQ